ncbi:hypothetical protein [Nocardia sp. NPDC057440]|uniref:hypothetical protein n=1 Tax=Nocardia sp. NPDC057440 TaxID=3346134 RepID=UPI0036728DD9
MDTRQQATPPFYVRAATYVVASALPLSLTMIGTAPAGADQQLPTGAAIVQTPYGPANIGDPFASTAASFAIPSTNALVAKPIADPAYTVDPAVAPGPDGAAPAQAVTPVEALNNRIRIGDVEIDRPEWLNSEQGQQINDAAAGTQAALAQGLTSVGIEPARSDRIAGHVIGSTAVGTAVGASAGSMIASPIAFSGAIIGAFAGAIAGLPFAPAGLLVVPVIGAAIGYAMVAAPFIAIGAAVGAAAGVGVGAIIGAVDPQPAPGPQQAPLA